MSKLSIDKYLNAKLDTVRLLCRALEVKELHFFGSSINGNFLQGKSDLDILVSFNQGFMSNLIDFCKSLKALYQCSIDAFCSDWFIHSELEEYLKNNKVLIYRTPNLYCTTTLQP